MRERDRERERERERESSYLQHWPHTICNGKIEMHPEKELSVIYSYHSSREQERYREKEEEIYLICCILIPLFTVCWQGWFLQAHGVDSRYP